jgi:hypothetical protein
MQEHPPEGQATCSSWRPRDYVQGPPPKLQAVGCSSVCKTVRRENPSEGQAVGRPSQPLGRWTETREYTQMLPNPEVHLKGSPSAARCSRSPAVSSPAPAASKKLAPPCVADVDSTLAACIENTALKTSTQIKESSAPAQCLSAQHWAGGHMHQSHRRSTPMMQ